MDFLSFLLGIAIGGFLWNLMKLIKSLLSQKDS
jgi:hypothetical protein